MNRRKLPLAEKYIVKMKEEKQIHPIAAKLIGALKENFPEILAGDGIKWNFTKFLVDRDGQKLLSVFFATSKYKKIYVLTFI